MTITVAHKAPSSSVSFYTNYMASDAHTVTGSSLGLLPWGALVVSADASAEDRAAATALKTTYGDRIQVCDGVAGQVEINAAIGALTSGRESIETVKCIGNFHPTAAITLVNYTRLDLTDASFEWDVDYSSAHALFMATGTLGTSTVLTAQGDAGDGIISVDNDPAIFAEDDYVLVRDEGATITYKDGEIHRLTATAASSITIDGLLWFTHTVANTATAQIVDMVHDFEIIGGKVTGVSATQAKDVFGIEFFYCANFKVQGMTIDKMANRGMYFMSCVAGDVSRNTVSGSARTGEGYGITYGSASNGLNIHHNHISHCRHSIAGGASAALYGAPMYCKVENNIAIGGLVGAGTSIIDMHECNAYGIEFNDNTIIGLEDASYSGISGGCPQWSASGNTLYMYAGGAAFADRGNYVRFVTLTNNIIMAGQGPVMNSTALESLVIDGLDCPVVLSGYAVSADTAVAASYISVHNVKARYGNGAISTQGILISDFGTVDVQGNEIRGMRRNGIHIEDAAKGIVANNISSANNQNGTNSELFYAAIMLYNSSYILAEGNLCYEDDDTPTQYYGIAEYGTANNNTIIGNKFWGNTVSGVLKAGAATTVRNNDGFIATGEVHTISGTLAGVTPAGIMLSLDNPFGQAVRVLDVDIDITTQGAGSGTMCVGVGSSATTDYATIFSVLPCDPGTTYPYFYRATKTATYGVLTSPINWATGSGNRYLNFYAHVANNALVATYTVTVMGV